MTSIVLIPKISHPTNLKNFRPISLCIVLYKVISKAIANHLQKVLEVCIDEAHSVFVLGRLISDNNILIAYELMHTFKQKRIEGKGSLTLKLDMSKAYNRVELVFLKQMM